MYRFKKKNTGGRAAGQTQNSKKQAAGSKRNRWISLGIVGVVVALILVILGISYYPTYVAPYRINVITVDNVNIRMDYFVKRVIMSGSDPMSLLNTIAREQIAKMAAPQFGIQISDSDIDQGLRQLASGTSGNISESEFKEWYRQRLNETGLSNAQYRDIVATTLITSQIQNQLIAQMPTTAEQIHVHDILLATEDEANDVKAQLENGADFATIAKEKSLDSDTRDNGGDAGWVPRGVLTPVVDYAAWELSTGNISDPVAYYNTDDPSNPQLIGYYIIMVSDKDPSREVDAKYLPTLQGKVLDDWFATEMKNHTVKYYGLNHKGFDSVTYAWVNYQVAKRTGNQNSNSSSQ